MKLKDETYQDTHITEGSTHVRRPCKMIYLEMWRDRLEVEIHSLEIQLAQAEAAIRKRRQRDAMD